MPGKNIYQNFEFALTHFVVLATLGDELQLQAAGVHQLDNCGTSWSSYTGMIIQTAV